MVNFRMFCILLVAITGVTSAVGAACNNWCRTLVKDEAWNSSGGTCYTYDDVYGNTMYSEKPKSDGTKTVQLKMVGYSIYDGCTTICTGASDAQVMKKGGSVTMTGAAIWYKCVDLAPTTGGIGGATGGN